MACALAQHTPQPDRRGPMGTICPTLCFRWRHLTSILSHVAAIFGSVVSWSRNVGIQPSCEGGRSPVTSESECREAAVFLNTPFQRQGTVTNIPPGCFDYTGPSAVYGGTGIQGVYWNAGSSQESTHGLPGHNVICQGQGEPLARPPRV